MVLLCFFFMCMGVVFKLHGCASFSLVPEGGHGGGGGGCLYGQRTFKVCLKEYLFGQIAFCSVYDDYLFSGSCVSV